MEPPDLRFTDSSKALDSLVATGKYCHKLLRQSSVYRGKKKRKKHQINLSSFFSFLFFLSFLSDYKLIWGLGQGSYCSNAVDYMQD